ncbi:MAG: leucine-rich repeat protein [bacterium]
MGEEAFSWNNLKSVEIPNSITSIDSYAFLYNELTKVKVPDSIETIDDSAFDNNVELIGWEI